jgi:hypothetical protein
MHDTSLLRPLMLDISHHSVQQLLHIWRGCCCSSADSGLLLPQLLQQGRGLLLQLLRPV